MAGEEIGLEIVVPLDELLDSRQGFALGPLDAGALAEHGRDPEGQHESHQSNNGEDAGAPRALHQPPEVHRHGSRGGEGSEAVGKLPAQVLGGGVARLGVLLQAAENDGAELGREGGVELLGWGRG